MKRNVMLITMIASCFLVGKAVCADWKYYGEFTTTPDVEEMLFYDSTSITNTDNSIKLWVKTVLYSDLEKILENKSIVEKAAHKIANGYNPPITKIHPKAVNATYIEEAANEPSIKTKAEISYQIKCSENKFRKISGGTFKNDGTPDLLLGISEWESITPESNANNLAEIVCEKK